jgi:hypothetical protein
VPRPVPEKLWTPTELRRVIVRAEALVGDYLDRLVRRYNRGRASPTPPSRPHRLIELLLRLRNAADHPEDSLAQNVASVAVVELDGMLQAFDDWSDDPCLPEFADAARDPRSFLHAVTTLIVASALREHHPGVGLVASSTPGRSADLAVVVTDEHGLAVEVKTSTDLLDRAATQSEALKFVQKCLKEAGSSFKGQLAAGKPAMLVIGGIHLTDSAIENLSWACDYVMAKAGNRRSHLLGIVVTTVLFDVRIVNSHLQVVLTQNSRIHRNRSYKGSLILDGDWAEDWHLRPA